MGKSRPNYGSKTTPNMKVLVFDPVLWAHLDLNQGPHPYQGCALTNLSYEP